jgi:hypothetical protein
MSETWPARVDAIDLHVRLYLLELRAASAERRQQLVTTWLSDTRDPHPGLIDEEYRGNLGPADIIAMYAPELMYPGQMGQGDRFRSVLMGMVCRAIAALATIPGGVNFFDRHWCLDHARGCDSQWRWKRPVASKTRRIQTVSVPGVS